MFREQDFLGDAAASTSTSATIFDLNMIMMMTNPQAHITKQPR